MFWIFVHLTPSCSFAFSCHDGLRDIYFCYVCETQHCSPEPLDARWVLILTLCLLSCSWVWERASLLVKGDKWQKPQNSQDQQNTKLNAVPFLFFKFFPLLEKGMWKTLVFCELPFLYLWGLLFLFSLFFLWEKVFIHLVKKEAS